MTLYGLPMQKVHLPNQTNVNPVGINTTMAASSTGFGPMAYGPVAAGAIPGLVETPIDRNFAYTLQNTARGNYYRIQGETDLFMTAERPVLPLTTINRSSPDNVTRGVLMLGGTFNDVPNFDPVIMGLLFEDSQEISGELRHDVPQWLPFMPATINRFWDIGKHMFSQNIIVTPGQFRATSSSSDPTTTGIMRLYSELNLLVYEGPGEEPDYKAPGIWQVAALPGAGRTLTFSALVTDIPANDNLPATGVMRVVVLYRHLNDNTWSRAELTYNPNSQLAVKTVVLPKGGDYEYFVQAADNAGNVSPALDHGNFFQVTVPNDDPEPEEQVVYVAPRVDGTIGSLNFTTSDILAYIPETDSWAMYFDGSDVDIKKGLLAFSLLEDGSILLTPRVRVNLPGVGWIEPQDIARFVPSAMGTNTAGTFSMFLDGSDVGLTSPGEAIDSISLTPAGKLVITPLGVATIPGAGGQTLKITGNHMLRFQANTYGAGTSGYWEIYQNINDIGLSDNRIVANWIDPESGDLFLHSQNVLHFEWTNIQNFRYRALHTTNLRSIQRLCSFSILDWGRFWPG